MMMRRRKKQTKRCDRCGEHMKGTGDKNALHICSFYEGRLSK